MPVQQQDTKEHTDSKCSHSELQELQLGFYVLDGTTPLDGSTTTTTTTNRGAQTTPSWLFNSPTPGGLKHGKEKAFIFRNLQLFLAFLP